ncbi:hypothetical protein SCHPADRAFT_1000146 [Schizopora paradoxa]|uniref:F-box domain-containing protein n=1 Tax=Schizopora paradoxa TaxID=27342 RepID=A0A0H2RCS2_9AGAM|nr:hypothetical protein SCHPADRAFT_1000146 [Schizopora paradoxa]
MSSSNDLRMPEDNSKETDDAMKIRLVEEISSLVLNSFEPSFKLPQQLEEEEQFLNSVTYDDLLSKGVRRNSGRRGFTLVSRSRTLLQRLESLKNILAGITSGIDLRIQHAEEQVQRMGSVCGLAALPSEVLSNIFSFAIHGIPSERPLFFAVPLISMRLSHVCRHFRDVVLSTPHFWTKISTTPRRPKIGLIEACIQRSKNRPLDIYLNLYTSEVKCFDPVEPAFQRFFPKGYPTMKQHLESDPVLSLLLPHIQRWRSLHLNYMKAEGFSGSTEIFEAVEGALFPMLETIAEYHYQIDEDGSYRDMPYVTSWNAPALSTLILCDCLPCSNLPIASSIKTFHVELYALSDVVQTLDLLNEMQCLNELYIDVADYQWYKATMDDEFIERSPIVLEDVKKYTFCFASHHAADEKEGDLERLRVIFSKVQVPNATHVRLEGRKTGNHRYLSRYKSYPLNLHRLLSDLPARFPNVVSCEISISRDINSSTHSTTFPLQFPSGLEEFKFTSNTSLSFPEAEAAEAVRELRNLRNLILGLNSLHYTNAAKDWVRWMVDNVKLHGGWQSFDRLMLLKCEEREDDDIYEYEDLILRDEVLEWCDKYNGVPKRDSNHTYGESGYDSDW